VNAFGARATALQSMALGADSTATGINGSAIGYGTRADGFDSTSVGSSSVASGAAATAVGRGALASGANTAAIGRSASASGGGSTAVGTSSNASASRAVAVGGSAQASASNAIAIGNAATASHADVVAIGAGAGSSATNQVTLGGTGSSVKIGDIDASTLAQSGPVNAVTIDGSGTLGKGAVATVAQFNSMQTSMARSLAVSDAQFNQLSGRVGTLEDRVDRFDLRSKGQDGGIAAVMALGGTAIAPGKSISMSVAAATYGGQQAFAGSVTGRMSESFYLSAGVTANTGDNRVGGRVAATFGF